MRIICITLWRMKQFPLLILLGFQRRQLNRAIHTVARQNRSMMTHTVASHPLGLAVHPVAKLTGSNAPMAH